MRGVLLATLLPLCACAADARPPGMVEQAPEEESAPDADRDGLCDFTEQELGSNPNAADTDGDGLPDLIELLHGYGAMDPEQPAPHQLARLEAQEGAAIDFPVRIAVTGDGQGVSGAFSPLPSSYGDEATASDFFRGTVAVSAAPSDAVRSINEASAHFGAVYGETLLAFSLRFEYPWALFGALECVRSYPFRYVLKSDDGATRAERGFLLLVGPSGAAHCIPAVCQ